MTLFYSKEPLSQGQGGEAIIVTVTSSPGQVIHTSKARYDDEFDEIYLYAASVGSATPNLNVDIGGLNRPFQVNAINAPNLILAGHPIRAGRRLSVWASAADVVILWGHVNRGHRDGVQG